MPENMAETFSMSQKLKNKTKLFMGQVVVHTFNFSAWEAEAGEFKASWVYRMSSRQGYTEKLHLRKQTKGGGSEDRQTDRQEKTMKETPSIQRNIFSHNNSWPQHYPSGKLWRELWNTDTDLKAGLRHHLNKNCKKIDSTHQILWNRMPLLFCQNVLQCSHPL